MLSSTNSDSSTSKLQHFSGAIFELLCRIGFACQSAYQIGWHFYYYFYVQILTRLKQQITNANYTEFHHFFVQCLTISYYCNSTGINFKSMYKRREIFQPSFYGRCKNGYIGVYQPIWLNAIPNEPLLKNA